MSASGFQHKVLQMDLLENRLLLKSFQGSQDLDELFPLAHAKHSVACFCTS
jgi:hypothetical protein